MRATGKYFGTLKRCSHPRHITAIAAVFSSRSLLNVLTNIIGSLICSSGSASSTDRAPSSGKVDLGSDKKQPPHVTYELHIGRQLTPCTYRKGRREGRRERPKRAITSAKSRKMPRVVVEKVSGRLNFREKCAELPHMFQPI